jgi:hypothetical protein
MVTDRIVHEGSDCAIALCNDVVIQVWEGPAHHHALKTMLAALQALKVREFASRRLFSLHIVAVTASAPDAEGRAIAAKFLEHLDLHVNVTEGTGFRASLIRMVILGILILSGVRAKHEVTPTLDAGIDALIAGGCRASRSELEEAVRTLREKLSARRAAARS